MSHYARQQAVPVRSISFTIIPAPRFIGPAANTQKIVLYQERIKAVVGLAADACGVTIKDTLGNARTGPNIMAKHLAMWLLCEGTINRCQVGRIFKRDHSTVKSACNKIETLRYGNEPLIIFTEQLADRSRMLLGKFYF